MTRLLLTSSFPPALGGLELYLDHVAGALDENLDVVAPLVRGEATGDAARPQRVHRFERTLAPIGHREAFRRIDRAVRACVGPGRRVFGPDPFSALLAANRNTLRWAAVQAGALPRSGVPPEVTYCGTALPSGVLARAIRRRTGAPYVVFAHGAEILHGAERPHHRALLGAVLRGAARVGAVSAFTADEVARLGVSAARIVRTPPGIDPTPFETGDDGARTRAAFGLTGRRVVLTHGRLDPRKGHDVVIDALPRVAERVPDVSYLITGTGPARDALEARASARGVADRVVFGGRVGEDDLGDLYAACDVFVMLSRRIRSSVEGFGIVCLEAGAAGRPVIGGASGGVADAVEDGVTGLLVEPESVEACAAALVALLGDPARRAAMGQQGRARVRAHFDLRAFIGRIRDIDADVRRETAQRRGETFSPSRFSG